MFGIEIERGNLRASPAKAVPSWLLRQNQHKVRFGWASYSYEGDCVFKKGRISQLRHSYLVRRLYSKRAWSSLSRRTLIQAINIYLNTFELFAIRRKKEPIESEN